MKRAVIVGNSTELTQGILRDFQDAGYEAVPVWADGSITGGLHASPLSSEEIFLAAEKCNAPIDILVVNLYAVFDHPEATIMDRVDYEALKKAYQ
ncbi:MAG: hypothetical protein IJL88_03695 [Clostridia bacterium]|nr:hypothetical protein [Clostridia bacterium]